MIRTAEPYQENLLSRAYDSLMINTPSSKITSVQRLAAACSTGTYFLDKELPVKAIPVPGRPEKPDLVEPGKVPRRRLGSEHGRAALIHAIAHIEFNAINLALDAVYRFRGMPDQYYLDWLSVAADESRHFQMLSDRLAELGFSYGDLPAHDGLWQMAARTSHDCMVRMALVPRVLEARGLDVTPGMITRLESAGDSETVAILRIILEEEVGHVEIGSRWFDWCCSQRALDPGDTFIALLEQYYGGRLRGPFNVEARLRAGFSEFELSALENLGKQLP